MARGGSEGEARATQRPLLGLLLCALLALTPSGVALAGAFNEPAGQGDVILRGVFDSGTWSFDRKGHLIRTPRYRKNEGFAYIQYGLTDWLQLILKPDFMSTRVSGAPGSSYRGFGTSDIGAQVRLLSFGQSVLAVSGTAQVPGTTARNDPALIGNTSYNADARVLLGTAFDLGAWPSFVDAEGAYRFRNGGAPDEVHVDLTVGTRPRPDLMLLVQSFTTIPTGPGTAWFPHSEYSNAGASVVYSLDPRWSLQLGGFTTVQGRNALHERALETSVWYHF